MGLLERASQLLKANVNHLMDGTEDPEVMLKQLIHDTDAAVVDLRGETVNAVARAKQLERKQKAEEVQAAELENKAGLAMDHDDEALARRILAQRVEAKERAATLAEELTSASALATRLKNDLAAMEEQAGRARRKKDELIRRKRAAEAQMKTQEAANRSAAAIKAATGSVAAIGAGSDGFGGYADAIGEIEARAEAARELVSEAEGDDRALRKLERESSVDDELARLRRKRAKA